MLLHQIEPRVLDFLCCQSRSLTVRLFKKNAVSFFLLTSCDILISGNQRSSERKGEKNNNKWKSSTAMIIKCNLICFYQIIQKRLKLLLLVSNLSCHGNHIEAMAPEVIDAHIWWKSNTVYHTMTICIFIATFGRNSYDDYYAYHETLDNRINVMIHWNTFASISTNLPNTVSGVISGAQTCAKYK